MEGEKGRDKYLWVGGTRNNNDKDVGLFTGKLKMG